jgi:uncharacterized repeat protein (TIGR01451 family)
VQQHGCRLRAGMRTAMRVRGIGWASSFLTAALVAACGGVDPSAPADDAAHSTGLSRGADYPGHHDDGGTPPGELPPADVAVSMIGTPPVVAAGAFVTYLITVSNVGGEPATAVQLVDVLPLDSRFVTVSTAQGSCSVSLGVVTCALGTLEPGASVLVRLQVSPLVPGVFITNVAAVTTTSLETNLSNNVASATNQVVVVNRGVGRGRGRGLHLGWERH